MPFQTDCHASREFLLTTPVVPEYRILPQPPQKDQISRLKDEFPAMAVGDEFTGSWIEQVADNTGFATMAFKIEQIKPAPDTFDEGQVSQSDDSDSQNGNDRLVVLAGILDDIIQPNEGQWGLLYHDILGLFMPGDEKNNHSQMADRIRTTFHEAVSSKIAIGLAMYPDHHFDNIQTIKNAVKALDHAAFLGTDSTVWFNAISLNISGDRYYAEGNLEKSIDEYENALQLDSENVNVRNSLGVCYGVLKQYDKALSAFEEAIGLAPGEVMTVYNYGLIKLLTGHPEQALDYFLRAECLRDDVFEVIFHIGKVYVQLNQTEKSLGYLKKAEALNDQSSGVYRLMGKCHIEMGDQDNAIAALTQAVRINPDDAQALSDLGRQYDLRNENFDIAMLFCERSTIIEPENGHFHHRMGRLYLKAQKPDQALSSFEKADSLGYDSRIAIDEANRQLVSSTRKAGSF